MVVQHWINQLQQALHSNHSQTAREKLLLNSMEASRPSRPIGDWENQTAYLLMFLYLIPRVSKRGGETQCETDRAIIVEICKGTV